MPNRRDAWLPARLQDYKCNPLSVPFLFPLFDITVSIIIYMRLSYNLFMVVHFQMWCQLIPLIDMFHWKIMIIEGKKNPSELLLFETTVSSLL